jgi:hypothetical protein
MIEQDGFVTTYDSHKTKSTEPTSPTQLESFKFEADMVNELVKSMYERTKTEEFKQCFGDSMEEADFNTISSDVLRLRNRIHVVNYNVNWFEERAKALEQKQHDKKEVDKGPVENLLYEEDLL